MTDDPTAPSLTANPLWTRARAMFARALAALGAISAIAARRTLTPEVRRQIVAWLAPLEHIVRKLLLAEAAPLRQSAKAYRTLDEVKPALCVQSRDLAQPQRTAQPSNSLSSGGSERSPKQIDLSHPESGAISTRQRAATATTRPTPASPSMPCARRGTRLR